jgi:hypothetical protein
MRTRTDILHDLQHAKREANAERYAFEDRSDDYTVIRYYERELLTLDKSKGNDRLKGA